MPPPPNWAFGYLEDYDVYHTRYLALQCQGHHDGNVYYDEFFNACCRPMLATEMLDSARPRYCNPAVYASSSSPARPSSSASAPLSSSSFSSPTFSSFSFLSTSAPAAPSASASSAPSSARHGLSRRTLLAIILPIVIIALLLMLCCFLQWNRRRKRRIENMEVSAWNASWRRRPRSSRLYYVYQPAARGYDPDEDAMAAPAAGSNATSTSPPNYTRLSQVYRNQPPSGGRSSSTSSGRYSGDSYYPAEMQQADGGPVSMFSARTRVSAGVGNRHERASLVGGNSEQKQQQHEQQQPWSRQQRPSNDRRRPSDSSKVSSLFSLNPPQGLFYEGPSDPEIVQERRRAQAPLSSRVGHLPTHSDHSDDVHSREGSGGSEGNRSGGGVSTTSHFAIGSDGEEIVLDKAEIVHGRLSQHGASLAMPKIVSAGTPSEKDASVSGKVTSEIGSVPMVRSTPATSFQLERPPVGRYHREMTNPEAPPQRPPVLMSVQRPPSAQLFPRHSNEALNMGSGGGDGDSPGSTTTFGRPRPTTTNSSSARHSAVSSLFDHFQTAPSTPLPAEMNSSRGAFRSSTLRPVTPPSPDSPGLSSSTFPVLLPFATAFSANGARLSNASTSSLPASPNTSARASIASINPLASRRQIRSWSRPNSPPAGSPESPEPVSRPSPARAVLRPSPIHLGSIFQPSSASATTPASSAVGNAALPILDQSVARFSLNGERLSWSGDEDSSSLGGGAAAAGLASWQNHHHHGAEQPSSSALQRVPSGEDLGALFAPDGRGLLEALGLQRRPAIISPQRESADQPAFSRLSLHDWVPPVPTTTPPRSPPRED